MPPPPEPRFALTIGWGIPEETLFWPEPNCRLFEQKYFNLKNLTDKIQSKISLRFSKYPVKVINRNLENTW